jgi:hybrid polyketide synthase/nonribosomal peptide synthetase ACE1
MEPIREPIAIVGSGVRFPGGANTLLKLWDLLEHPRDVSEPISSERFNVDRFYHPKGSHHGTTSVKDAYFIAGNARKFDAPFFNVLPSGTSSCYHVISYFMAQVMRLALQSRVFNILKLC